MAAPGLLSTGHASRGCYLAARHSRGGMQLRHPDSDDPIGRALECAERLAKEGTQDHPLTPERFWEDLKQDGFLLSKERAGSDDYGRFFAHLVLDHAVALGKIAGNTALHHYWAAS